MISCSSRCSPLQRTFPKASRSTCSDLRFRVPLRPLDQRDGDILTTLNRAVRSSRSLRQHAATYAKCWIALNWLPTSMIEHPPRMASVKALAFHAVIPVLAAGAERRRPSMTAVAQTLMNDECCCDSDSMAEVDSSRTHSRRRGATAAKLLSTS